MRSVLDLTRALGYPDRVRLGVLFVAGCSYAPTTGEPDAAALPDAFDATRCPADYTLILLGQTSRYRVIIDERNAWDHSDDCATDLPGATHLVAIDTPAELAQIEVALDDLPNNRAWVGVVQLRFQAMPTMGWLSITGGPVLDVLWAIGEPNDGTVEDDGENFASIDRDRDGLSDTNSGDSLGGMCECDGKPRDPAAVAAIDANRQN